MDPDGYRKVQKKGEITLPKSFRDELSLEKGDKIYWKRHSRDKNKLILSVED